jgi:hypothetical protein
MSNVFIVMDGDYPEGLPWSVCKSVEQAIEFIKEDTKDPYWMGGEYPFIHEYEIDSKKPICTYDHNGVKLQ